MSGDDDRRSALAIALGEALSSGSVAAMLEAGRRVHQRDPGFDEAARVVEALELLMSQVWLDSQDRQDPFAVAGGLLEAGRFDDALAIYETQVQRADVGERAAQLIHRVRVVKAALAGQALPAHDSLPSVEIDVSAPGLRSDVPGPAELGFDDVTAPHRANVPGNAYREEPTMQLQLGDYELSDKPAVQDSTVHDSTVRASEETTRVAGPGELPLEQLRAEMAAERNSDAAIDGLLDEIEDEDDEHPTEVSGVEPIPMRGEPIVPQRSASPEIPSVIQLTGEPPLVPGPAALAREVGRWVEPGRADQTPSGVIVGSVAESWAGLPIDDHDTSFEPGVESITSDQWGDGESAPVPGSKEDAEQYVRRGELGEALRIYQELAARTPDDEGIWKRVEEIAKALQRKT